MDLGDGRVLDQRHASSFGPHGGKAMLDTATDERVERVEALLAEVEALEDPARTTALDSIRGILDLYGEGLACVLRLLRERGDREQITALADDALVGHLMLVHGLHPVDLEARILHALEEVRPYLRSHGGDVRFLSTDGRVVRLRLEGTCDGPSSAHTLRLAVERAVQESAPEIEAVEAEGPEGVPVEAPASQSIGVSLPPIAGGAHAVQEVSGQRLLFLRLEEDLYAYRPPCPGCGSALEDAHLDGDILYCAECGRGYNVREAGRCLEAPREQLEPVPLLTTDQGAVCVTFPDVSEA